MGNATSELQHIANALTGLAKEEKQFLEAVLHGRTSVARESLKVNPNVIYARTRNWENAWHIAALNGDLDMMEVLHKYAEGMRKPLPGEPMPIHIKTKKGFTPIMVAVQAGHHDAMLYMLTLGANIRDRDMFGNTPIHHAALKGHMDILQLLLAKEEAEHEEYSSKNLNVNRGRELLMTGINKLMTGINTITAPITSTLAAPLVAQLGPLNFDVGDVGEPVRAVDLCNEAGLQPLHFAVWGGQEEAALLLIGCGAQLSARSTADSVAEVTCNGGSTALHVATLRNNTSICKMILNEYSKQLLIKARGNREWMKAFNHNDPREVRDQYGYTAHELATALKREEALLDVLDPREELPEPPELPADFFRDQTATKGRQFRRSEDTALRVWPIGEVPAIPPPPSPPPQVALSVKATQVVNPDPGPAWEPSFSSQVTCPAGEAWEPSFSHSVHSKNLWPKAAKKVAVANMMASCARAPSGSLERAQSGASSLLPAKPKVPLLPPPPSAKMAASQLDNIPDAGSDDGKSEQPSPDCSTPGDRGSYEDRHPIGRGALDSPVASSGSARDGTQPQLPPPSPIPDVKCQPPLPHFFCPITNEILTDPVTACDGRSYERIAVEMWMKLAVGGGKLPGGSEITSSKVSANEALRQEITAWKLSNSRAAAGGSGDDGGGGDGGAND